MHPFGALLLVALCATASLRAAAGAAEIGLPRAAMVATCSTQRSDDAAHGSDGETASGEQYPLCPAQATPTICSRSRTMKRKRQGAQHEIKASETKPKKSVHSLQRSPVLPDRRRRRQNRRRGERRVERREARAARETGAAAAAAAKPDAER